MKRKFLLLRKKIKRSFRRGEAGFAMVIVLVALLLLSVLGAGSLLLMVSSLQGMVNMKPEEIAFQVAESGLYVAHAQIVESKVTPGVPTNGSILSGSYTVKVDLVSGSTTDYIVTSLGSYSEGGDTYRRKLQEQVYYSGEQAFDAMRNYIFFAGRDLTINENDQVNYIPVVIGGNIRAERNLSMTYYANEAEQDALIVNGNVEAKENISIDTEANQHTQFWHDYPSYYDPTTINTLDGPGANVMINGDIKAGSRTNTSTAGKISLTASSKSGGDGSAYLFAGKSLAKTYTLYSPLPLTMNPVKTGTPPAWPAGEDDRIFTGNYNNSRTVADVYIPKPNMEYYKTMAIQQGHYKLGNWTINENIKKNAISSETVYYCTGNMAIGNVTWQDPQTNGVFVCEGDFDANGTYSMRIDCKFQVIAGGDINIGTNTSGTWDDPLTNAYFFYAKGDVNMCMSMFSQQNLQVTALNDIYLYDAPWGWGAGYSFSHFIYRAPQIDVSGWPIDITVKDWKELPADQ